MGRTKQLEIRGDTPIRPVDNDELPPEFRKFDNPFGLPQHYLNIVLFGLAQGCALYYIFYLLPLQHVSIYTVPFALIYGYAAGFGTTVGCHRYWTHKTFKANLLLQILLMLLQTAGFQYPIFKWCRDHRVHHKYTDTNADPHNSKRGFWFSHITWLFQAKHPDVEKALKIVDISDLAKDPVVRFQSRYYWELFILASLIVPMTIMHFLLTDLSFFHNFVINWARIGVSLHITFLVNSIAHMWGNKPYDRHISPVENKLVSILAIGEGWHNYHHTFPWDYKSAEFGYKLNLSTFVIHFFAWIGWAWDLKTVSHKLLVDRINRTGDGSHPVYEASTKGPHHCNAEPVAWGWGDKELKKEDIDITETLFPEKQQ